MVNHDEGGRGLETRDCQTVSQKDRPTADRQASRQRLQRASGSVVAAPREAAHLPDAAVMEDESGEERESTQGLYEGDVESRLGWVRCGWIGNKKGRLCV